MGLKLIPNKMNQYRDLQTWFSLSISIPRDSFFQEKDKLGKFVPVCSKVFISIKFQGIMYHYPFWEGRGFYPRKTSCGSRQRKQGGYGEE